MAESTEVELVGLGAGTTIPEEITTEQVWKVLLLKIEQPNLFLPVTGVITRPTDDGKGTYREMSMGPHTICENIYTDESKLEVKFVVTDDIIEHVNIIHTNATSGERTLEFYKRHSQTGERTPWEVPKSACLDAIAKVLDYARTV